MLLEIRKATRHTAIYSVGTALRRLAAFLLIPLYTRYLSPSEYGTLALILIMVSVLSIFLNLGMSSALFKFFFETDDRRKRTRIVSTVFFFLVLSSTVLVLVSVKFADSISRLLFRSYDYGSLLTIAFITALMDALTNIPLALLRAYQKPIQFTFFSLFRFLSSVSFILFFVLFRGEGVLGVLKGELIASIGTWMVLFPIVLRHVRFSFSTRILGQLLSFGVPLVPSGLALWILTLSDRYFLQYFSTLKEVGLYSLGYKLGTLINVLVVAPFTLAWGPLVFSVQRQSNAKAIYSAVLTYFLFIAAFVGLCFSLYARPLLEKIAMPEYLPSHVVVFPITCSYILIFAAGATLSKKTKLLALVTGFAASLNLVLNYLLIPRYGMMGAAFATILSYCSMAFLMLRASSRVYFIQYEFSRVGKIAVVTLSIFGLSLLTHRLSFWLESFCKTVLILAYPFLLNLLRFLSENEKQEIRKFLSSPATWINRKLLRRAEYKHLMAREHEMSASEE
ncbi:MAG: oligosaccharide flippase family protein [Thermoplasmata archaeon]